MRESGMMRTCAKAHPEETGRQPDSREARKCSDSEREDARGIAAWIACATEETARGKACRGRAAEKIVTALNIKRPSGRGILCQLLLPIWCRFRFVARRKSNFIKKVLDLSCGSRESARNRWSASKERYNREDFSISAPRMPLPVGNGPAL